MASSSGVKAIADPRVAILDFLNRCMSPISALSKDR